MGWIPVRDILSVTSSGGRVFTSERDLVNFKADVLKNS